MRNWLAAAGSLVAGDDKHRWDVFVGDRSE
jgi:hypothetical protein